jgi:hypothetical protein
MEQLSTAYKSGDPLPDYMNDFIESIIKSA